MENKDAQGGVGLQSMQYRASLLGGKFDLNANPTGGTNVTVSLTP
jgi:signal transduction histidine kinase